MPQSMPPDVPFSVLARRAGSSREQGRWCSWGFCSQNFRRYYSAQLLVVMWACLEVGTQLTADKLNLCSSDFCSSTLLFSNRSCQEGKNPYAMAAAESTKTATGMYDKIVDLCLKARGHSFFSSSSWVSVAWRHCWMSPLPPCSRVSPRCPNCSQRRVSGWYLCCSCHEPNSLHVVTLAWTLKH